MRKEDVSMQLVKDVCSPVKRLMVIMVLQDSI